MRVTLLVWSIYSTQGLTGPQREMCTVLYLFAFGLHAVSGHDITQFSGERGLLDKKKNGAVDNAT